MYLGYLRLNCVDVFPNPSAYGPLFVSAVEFPQPPPNGDCNSMGLSLSRTIVIVIVDFSAWRQLAWCMVLSGKLRVISFLSRESF
jgi:hypothetical protein